MGEISSYFKRYDVKLGCIIVRGSKFFNINNYIYIFLKISSTTR